MQMNTEAFSVERVYHKKQEFQLGKFCKLFSYLRPPIGALPLDPAGGLHPPELLLLGGFALQTLHWGSAPRHRWEPPVLPPRFYILATALKEGIFFFSI